MQPIINPIWFYLIEMSERLNIMFVILGIIILIILGLYMSIRWVEGMTPILPKHPIIKTTFATILIIIGVMFPSKETCYKMMLAFYITPNNIEYIKENTKDLINYITDEIVKIKSN